MIGDDDLTIGRSKGHLSPSKLAIGLTQQVYCEKETQFEHMKDTFLAKIIHRSVRAMVFEGRGNQLFTEGGVRLADRQQTHYKECPLAAQCHHSLGLRSLS